MWLRVRLKTSDDISRFTGQARVILEVLKKYGMRMMAVTGISLHTKAHQQLLNSDTSLLVVLYNQRLMCQTRRRDHRSSDGVLR